MYGYIYLILNKVNGKTYIGQKKFVRNLTWNKDKYMGSGKLLKPAYRKYGIENFEKFLIQYVYTRDEANKQEVFWIHEYKTRGKAEYNIAKGGNGGQTLEHPWNYGKKMSAEFCIKCSEGHKGQVAWNKGKKGVQVSPNKGKELSEEHRRKLSEAHKGQEPWNKGKKGVQQAWNKGKSLSEEQKKRISETLKGKPNKGVSIALTGRSWYNNGIKQALLHECPIGWVKGKIR